MFREGERKARQDGRQSTAGRWPKLADAQFCCVFVGLKC